ncbi:MAG: DUF58 domain-containing protein [Gammaproteobacteria bacterium]|nr:DUF58 domain-containing protein [Gammaproteobacteria bacterium]
MPAPQRPVHTAPSQPPGRLSLQRFLRGEGPEAGPIHLGQRRVYILPSKMGVYIGVMLLVMLLGAVNYNNNLGLALTFLLASIGIVGILHSYRNLLHLRLDVGPVPSAFCGETLGVPVHLDNRGQAARYALKFYFPQQVARQHSLPASTRTNTITDLGADHWQRTTIPLTTRQRGLHPLPRLSLRSTFPLGLFQVWAHVHGDAQHLVYPAPDRAHGLFTAPSFHLNQDGDRGQGADDFAGLRSYHSGDSLRHVHWKTVAREQGMHTKQFGGDRAEELWLDWEALPGLDTEARLSRLCRWVLDADAAALRYGLRLPGTHIAPDSGPAHRHQCLKALALYLPPPPMSDQS